MLVSSHIADSELATVCNGKRWCFCRLSVFLFVLMFYPLCLCLPYGNLLGKYCHIVFALTVCCLILMPSWAMISALFDDLSPGIPATNSWHPRLSLSPFSAQQKLQSRLLQCVLVFFEDRKSQPSGPSFKLETHQRLVSRQLCCCHVRGAISGVGRLVALTQSA